MNKMPRSNKESEAFFRSVLPEVEQITLRPMFGNLAGFVGGKMFAGLYGDELFVRLSEEDRSELLKVDGASIFEPMAGRQMKEYVVFPKSWKAQPAKVKPWVARSLEWSRHLPDKKAKKR
jgi:TfoX/Sxy family transcriptional regulator of competence genes